jgi:two-component system chemotaxis response regulator CheV
MNTVENEINERAALTSSNKFELMLFRLGKCGGAGRSELYGINVFKLRELMAMPEITTIAGAPPHLLGVVNIRGQIVPVIDLPALLGCTPENGLKILMITEFARTTQAFAVEDVDEIVRSRRRPTTSQQPTSPSTRWRRKRPGCWWRTTRRRPA